MKSITLANFVKIAQVPEDPKTRLDLLPSVIYNKFIAKHLTSVDELCVQLATSREPRTITKKEIDDMVKCDADKIEDEVWNDYDPDDDYDRKYDPDFSAQWDEQVSDGEVD